MKILKHFQNDYVDLYPENEMEALYEKGDCVEVEYTDYLIFDYHMEDGKPVYSAHKI